MSIVAYGELLERFSFFYKNEQPIDLSTETHVDFLAKSFEHYTLREKAYLLTFTNLFDLSEESFPKHLIKSGKELETDLSFYFFQFALATPLTISSKIFKLILNNHSYEQYELATHYAMKNFNITHMNIENIHELTYFFDLNKVFNRLYLSSFDYMDELLMHENKTQIIKAISPYLSVKSKHWLVNHFFKIDNALFEKKEDLVNFLKLTFTKQYINEHTTLVEFNHYIPSQLKEALHNYIDLINTLSSNEKKLEKIQKVDEFLALVEKHTMDATFQENSSIHRKNQLKI